MNRFGWFLLLLFLAAALTLGLMIAAGEDKPEPRPVAAETPEAEAVAVSDADLVIPVTGVAAEDLADTWGQSREGGARAHQAIDIMAPRGTLVVAAAPGRVEKLFDSVPGGRTVYVRSPNGRIIYYYAHLDAYRDGLAEGQTVRTGEVIGTVGSTGNASQDAPHLHFEVKRMADGESWHEGRPVNPYPLLAGPAAAR